MQIKKELRKELKAKRKNLEKKAQSDEFIRENLICSDLYLESKQVLFYAGLDDEINLDECINDALLPHCLYVPMIAGIWNFIILMQ